MDASNRLGAAIATTSLLLFSAYTHADATKSMVTDQDMIKSAMSAAPAAVGAQATIVAMEANGKMRTLRQGKNGFTCIPDNPATPGPDPMCADKNAMEWVDAWISRAPQPPSKVGFMYMLSGGTDASNTDPYAQEPAPNNHWIKTGPHVMIVGGDTSYLDAYPKSADPDTANPYVMWADTPYRHLMAPVK